MKKLLLTVVAALLTLTALAQQFGRVEGLVTDKDTKAVVQNAVVTITGETLKTPVIKINTDKGFMAMLPMGTYTVRIEAQGYQTFSFDYEVMDEDNPLGKIKIEKADTPKK